MFKNRPMSWLTSDSKKKKKQQSNSKIWEIKRALPPHRKELQAIYTTGSLAQMAFRYRYQGAVHRKAQTALLPYVQSEKSCSKFLKMGAGKNKQTIQSSWQQFSKHTGEDCYDVVTSSVSPPTGNQHNFMGMRRQQKKHEGCNKRLRWLWTRWLSKVPIQGL